MSNGYLLGRLWWFLEVVGLIWRDEKIVPEIGWPKGTRVIPEVPGRIEIDPRFPY